MIVEGEPDAASRAACDPDDISVQAPGQPGSGRSPLLADRPLIDGASAAYVCRGFLCERPVTDPSELAAQLTA